MSDNMFARTTARGPLRRVATGFGMAVAAYALVGLGAGAAAAAPQQPFAADDPIPGMPGGAGSAVNIANSLFGSLSGLMNNVIPGAGDLLMPATSALGGGGAGLPGGLPGGLGVPGGLPGGVPGGLPGGLPGQTLPGQTPGLGGLPGQTLPGQTPGLGGLPGQVPGYPGGLTSQQLPGQTPGLGGLPGQNPGGPAPLAPGVGQVPLAGQQGPVASASANGGTLVHVPVV
ncbi:hypothetical protein [Mycobacterium sp. 1245111.1]|uniref:hypothetical protein n=1 Tax=Mycobacterium sp. 1245111.1 TaxID=1834073 RepID=UPI000A4BEDC2|nr:hypothetical protein [Mycobacterium sp. 1245111.1]